VIGAILNIFHEEKMKIQVLAVYPTWCGMGPASFPSQNHSLFKIKCLEFAQATILRDIYKEISIIFRQIGAGNII
jgi:hypothetical protein